MAHPTLITNKVQWLDTLLLGGIAVAIVSTCAVLTWMAWQTPNIVAFLNTPMSTPPFALAVVTPTPSPTVQATPALPTSTPLPTTPAPATPTLLPTTPALPTATAPPSPTPTPSPTPQAPAVLPAKKIVIDLSEQTLTAYEDATPVFSSLISAGQSYTPTPIGEFAIYSKVRSQTMSGPGYVLPNVEFVAYFYQAYALHGTYWHDNFGNPMSHGCVNMRNNDAQWLYSWAPIGTPVSVRR